MTSREPEPFLLDGDQQPVRRLEPQHARPIAGPHAPAILHRPDRKAGRRLWPGPSRPLLGVVLVLGLCVAATCWNAKPFLALPQELLRMDLLAAAPSPKVNSTSVKAPALPARPRQVEKPREEPPLAWYPEPPLPVGVPVGFPEPPLPRQVEVPVPPPAMDPVPLPMTDSAPLPVAEPLRLPTVACGAGSLDCSCFRDLHTGDTPMMHNWNVVKLSSLLAAALAVPALPTARAEGQEDIKAVKESIDKLNTTLKDFSENVVKALDVKGDIKALNDNNSTAALSIATMKGTITVLQEQVRDLKVELEKLQGRDTSKYFPTEKVGMDDIRTRLSDIERVLAKLADGRISKALPAVNTGRIMLVNRYPEEMLFVVNKQNYRVAPFSTLPLENQPAGVFEYEVISGNYGFRGGNRPLLEAGKTYTITVR